jgi:iron complex outermembrane receptor protein
MGGSIERNTGLAGQDAVQQQRLGVRLEPQVAGGQLSLKAEVYHARSKDFWGTPTVRAFSDAATPYARDSLLSEEGHGGAVQARYAWRGAQGADNVLQTSIDYDKSIHAGVWGSGTAPQKFVAQAPSTLQMGGTKTDVDVDFQQRRIHGAHDFIWGLNLRHTSDNLLLPATPYLLLDGKSQRLNYSAFVHDEISLLPERFKLIVGSKFEKDGLTGFNVQPNVRALYTPGPNEAYWGALSRSVRSSRRTESLATLDISAQDAHVVDPGIRAGMLTAVTQVSPKANAKLQAEEALSLEGGWRKQFSNFLSVDTSLFVTDYNHLRGARLLSNPFTEADIRNAGECTAQSQVPGTCYFTLAGYNTNLDKARSYGGEFSVEWHPRAWWKLQTAYSHLHVKGVHSGDQLGDIQVTAFENSAPRHQFSLDNHFSLAQNLNLNVRLRYNSETAHYTLNRFELTRLAPYTGLDMRLAWKPNRNTELSLQGRNLLKNRHTEFINIFPVSRAYDVQRSLLAQAVVRF